MKHKIHTDSDGKHFYICTDCGKREYVFTCDKCKGCNCCIDFFNKCDIIKKEIENG